MTWSIRCNFDYIMSYAGAVKAWENAVIFPRDRKLDPAQALLAPRGLVDRRKKHMTIQRTESDDIVLRLYDRPIVTWHKDNAVTICAYPTRSTALFACHCVPEGMFVVNGRTFYVVVDKRTYRVQDQITFRQKDNTWKADKIAPWSIPFVNRERAKQALRDTGYEEFRLWFKVYVQMASRSDESYGSIWINDDKAIEMLHDRTKWRELITRHFPEAWHYPDKVLYRIRQAIYHKYNCIEHKSVPFLG
jgi:hypothetical protein